MDEQRASTPAAKPRKRVLLHIGTHKTGTTSIQRLCAPAAPALLDRGVLYPQAGRPLVSSVSHGHHLLPWSLSGHVTKPPFWPPDVDDPLSVWRDLCVEIDASPAGLALISSEEFDTLEARHVSALVDFLSPYDVTVICFLRRVDVFVQAMYTTDVLHGRVSSDILAYAETMRTPMNYEALLSPWKHAFGGARVYVVPYLADLDRAWNAVGALLAVAGVESAALAGARGASEETQENVSAPWHVIQAIRALRNMGMAEVITADFVAAQLAIQSSARAEHDLLAPSVRRGMVRGSLPQLQSVFSSPLSERELAWFRGDELDASDDAWSATHQHDAALKLAFKRLREFVETNPRRPS